MYPSPGISTERCRIYQARELSRGAPPGRLQTSKAGLQQRWTPLAEAVFEVLSGHITSGLAVAGLLAAAVRHGMRDNYRGRTVWPTPPELTRRPAA